MEMERAIGFLTNDGVLYCSRSCADGRAGQYLDSEDYEALADEGRLRAEILCPACGAEFAVEWPETAEH